MRWLLCGTAWLLVDPSHEEEGAGGYLVSASIWCSSQVSIQGGVRGEAHATTRCCKPPYNLCTPARAGTWNILSGASVTPVLKTLLKIELNWSPEKEDWSHICHWHASHLSATSLFCLHSSAAYRHLSKTLCVIKWYKIKRAITDLAIVSSLQAIISLNPVEHVILDIEPEGFRAAVTLFCLQWVTSVVQQNTLSTRS